MRKLIPRLLDWFTANARDLPWRRTRKPYAIWVSEIMLQQTQVKTVVPYWKHWMRALPTIKSVAKASPDKIHKLWEGLGYYTRARNLQKSAQQIVEQHGGKFPENFDDVLALPGIGRYTAGAICSIAFNKPAPILDGNVVRVLTRIFGIAENPRVRKTNERLWKLAEELVVIAGGARFRRAQVKKDQGSRDSRLTENQDCSRFNQSLMELGATVCSPRNPQCTVCPARNLCVALRENRVEELPNLGKRAAATVRHFVAFIAERNGRFLVRQRPAGVVNAHLWEFPNVEVTAGILPAVETGFPPPRRNGGQPGGKIAGNSESTRTLRRIQGARMPPSLTGRRPAATSLARIAENQGFELLDARPLCAVKHSITRYRITLEAFLVAVNRFPPQTVGFWKTPAQMQALAFTSAHRNILSRLTPPPK